MFPVGGFLLHSILELVGEGKSQRWLIIMTYIVAGLLTVFFVWQPDTFLLPSIPKMYFPNYYEPGILNWTRLVFLDVIIFPYILYCLARAYRRSGIGAARNRYAYFIIALVCGFCVVFIPNFLVADITIDPLLGMVFAVICMIPFAYGAIAYELFNIKVIAKQAFIYAISIAFAGGGLTLLTCAGIWIRDVYPGFPAWTIALASAVIAVTASFIVWLRLRENDVLKYEFITTVTHKFRTPLTQIRWATEELSALHTDDAGRQQIRYIQTANAKLVELIDILAAASAADSASHEYTFEPNNLSRITLEAVSPYVSRAAEKHITLESRIDPGVRVMCDAAKIHFVIQTLVGNALVYTQAGGTITVVLSADTTHATCIVRDTGIGMNGAEISRVFSKFYRSTSAQSIDTEGLGIGLYMAKKILDRHHGRIHASSAGGGKGSEFSFRLRRLSADDSQTTIR